MIIRDFLPSTLLLFWTITAFFVAIVSVVNWKKPRNANRCFKKGLIAIAIHLIVMVAYLLIAPSMNIIGVVLLLFYAVHIVGALRLKNVWQSIEVNEETATNSNL